MVDSNCKIVGLKESEHERATGVLKRAFYEDPIIKYIHMPETQTDKVLTWAWGGAIRYGLIFGRAEATPDVEGVAIWSRPGYGPISYWQLFRVGLLPYPLKMGLKSTSRLFDSIDSTEKAHHKYMKEDHWYLFFMGVDPKDQCKGIGSALIRSVTEEADADGLPCYLEASSQKSRDLYLRHGFKVNEEIHMPKGGPPFWSMSRQARAKDSEGSYTLDRKAQNRSLDK